MGDIGSRLADTVVLTAEDPRTEDLNKILSQMQSQITGKAKIIIEPDRQGAISTAVSLANKGDVIGIFGKGHERSMCFGKIEYPWSDQDAVKKALSQKTSKK
jgi:UDP-N-acetylmuramoyl-L-alanyl-D-glutamate--2,6-diaminopimelate ligase